MSNTPETDAMEYFDAICNPDRVVEADFCRKLERERDKYQEQADALVDRLADTQERMIDAERERDEASNALIIAVDEMVQAQSQLREAKRELDEERDTVATMEIRHAAAMFHAQRVVDDANQLKEQRDRLAEALKQCREDSVELLGERDWWQNETRLNYHKRYELTRDNVTRADKALQSLTTNELSNQ